MDEENGSTSNSGSQDPYILLGLDPGASYDEIKSAKEYKIIEAGDDLIRKAKIESAYDSLLMVSLKERQKGNISNEAINASEREKLTNQSIGGFGTSLLTRLKGENNKESNNSSKSIFPIFSLPTGQGLTIRISIGILAFVLLLISPDQSNDLILSVTTISLFVSQIKRGRKPLPSLGWSVVLLSFGLIIGGLITVETGLNSADLYYLSAQKVEALPALFLLFLGILFLE
tara:strand:+ start:9132 stop:9821 length:690 start_codon:yes stop_codon:yes gene_type:complete